MLFHTMTLQQSESKPTRTVHTHGNKTRVTNCAINLLGFYLWAPLHRLHRHFHLLLWAPSRVQPLHDVGVEDEHRTLTHTDLQELVQRGVWEHQWRGNTLPAILWGVSGESQGVDQRFGMCSEMALNGKLDKFCHDCKGCQRSTA